MKKSRIIIPALGMLLLSTAASVSGTVAWFTSVQSASAQTTSFAVRKLGGDLALVIKTAADGESYGTGTKKTGNAVDLAGTNPALCDASYDHAAKKVYKASSDAQSFSQLASEADWDVTNEGEGGNVTYYAVSWTFEFTYTFGGSNADVNLYFDVAASTLSGAQVTAGTGDNATKYTYKGFRIAFVNGDRSVVWAGGRTADDTDVTIANLKYQGGTAVANATAYTNPNSTSAAGTLVTGAGNDAGIAPVDLDTAGTATRADYIGTFTSDVPTISVKCIAWYEGNDPTVVNGARLDTTTATMGFYTRPAA